ncbi:MAG TPA: hypothetical protein VFK42_02595 [Acidimicrobiales bacterium]|nr:hypothetical protein [Acidimicrobiales bacterium]
MNDDPVLRRRAQIARLADLGQKVGYGLFGVAVVAFVVAAVVGFSPAWVTVVVVAMLAGSVVLAPAIVLGFAAKAADREDREVGR